MFNSKLSTEELKNLYLVYRDEFYTLRNKEYEGLPLTENEKGRYVYLVDEMLIPLQKMLDERGEGSFLDDYAFDYEY